MLGKKESKKYASVHSRLQMREVHIQAFKHKGECASSECGRKGGCQARKNDGKFARSVEKGGEKY